MALTQVDQGLLGSYAQYTGFKNRIINGAMMIDQRNAGASITPSDTSNVTYNVDRFNTYGTQASKFSVQQNAGSVTPPAGFQNYVGVTVGASANVTVGATDRFWFQQVVEGYNTADFGFGAAGASTVTLSFWVRSSLTGTFSGALLNYAANRSYPFSYTISAANTWEQKTVTIAGDTSGTWLKTNSGGLQVCWDLGSGSNYKGTANAWAGSYYLGVTGATNLVATNSATFYITGVQLEKGSTATSFDYRPYGTELNLCQRYYEVTGTTGANGSFIISGYVSASGQILRANVTWAISKRTTPTVSIVGTWGASGLGQPSVAGYSETGARLDATSTTSGIVYVYSGTSGNCITSSAEL